jgi:hypothetical protein
MKTFYRWGMLITAIGYLVLATYVYSTDQRSIAQFTRRDVLQAFGVLFAVLVIYKAVSSLIADRRQDRNKQSPRFETDAKITASDVKVPVPRTNSFETALRKNTLLLSFVFVFFLSIPLLLRISTVKANGMHFTPHDWFVVTIGEVLIALVLVIGWFGAKRKYEKTHGRRY